MKETMGCGIVSIVLAVLAPILWFIFRESLEAGGNFSGLVLVIPFSSVLLIIGTVLIAKALDKKKVTEEIRGLDQAKDINKIKADTIKEHGVQVFEQYTGECPYCNSSNVDEGIYSWMRVCYDCNKEWSIE